MDALLGVVGPLALGRRLIARFGQAVGENVKAAMMTRRWSPISPNVLRISPIFSSIVPASDFEPRFLALVASKTILAPVDGDRNL